MKTLRVCLLAFCLAGLTPMVGCGPDSPKEREIAVELPGGATMRMVWIEPGSFSMGGVYPMWQRDERPPHKVELTKGFYLGECEVTQAQWESVMGSGGSYAAATATAPSGL